MIQSRLAKQSWLLLSTLAAGCASTRAAVAPPSPPVVATHDPARPTPDGGPLRGAVSSVVVRVELLQRELAEARPRPSAETAIADDFFFASLRDDERVTRARLDATRPLRSWYGPLDAPVLERLEAFRELGRAHVSPPRADYGASASADVAPPPDTSPDAARWRALHAQCPVGGFAQRIVWPSLEPEVTARVLDEGLDASRWQRLPPVAGFDVVHRWSHHAVALGVSHTRDAVVLDLWYEPLDGCQSDADRAGFSARAVERLFGLRGAETAAQDADDDALYATQAGTLDEARRAFAVGVMSIESATGPHAPGEAPVIDPEVIPSLALGGLREADSALRLVGDGAYTTAVRRALRRDARGSEFTVQSEVGRDEAAFPAEGLWSDAPSVTVVGARDALDVRAAWLAGFGPARDPDEWTSLRRQAGYQGAALAPLHDLAASLHRALRAAQPPGAPWPATERVDRELAVTVPATADARAPGARLHLALLAADTTSPVAACALATSPAGCAPVRLAVGATRGVPGGFARLVAVGPRFVVVVGASRAAVAAVTVRDVAAAAPCAGVIPAEQLGVDLRGFVRGAADVAVTREGARITARLRSDASP